MRREVAVLREELARLAEEVSRLKVTRNVSPLYDEAMALAQDVAPRTLQRFLESIVWDEAKLRDRCQQLVASEHADCAHRAIPRASATALLESSDFMDNFLFGVRVEHR